MAEIHAAQFSRPFRLSETVAASAFKEAVAPLCQDIVGPVAPHAPAVTSRFVAILLPIS